MDDELGICHAHGRLRCGECMELEGLRQDVERLRAQLAIAREALQKIYEPMKYHHWEAYPYTRAACFQFVAQQALAAMDKEGA